MNDRELLELAAKAADLPVEFDCEVNDWFACGRLSNGNVERWWNPLLSNDDSFRLMVDLVMCITHWPLQRPPHVMVGYRKGPNDGANVIEDYGSDMYAATRRAVVNAAAEIGKHHVE